MHHSLLQGKFEGGMLVSRQIHSLARVTLEADGLHSNLILPAGQVFDPVAPPSVRQHTDRYSGLRVLSLDKRSLEGHAVGTLYRAGNGSGVGKRGKQNRQADKTCDLADRTHSSSLVCFKAAPCLSPPVAQNDLPWSG